MSATALSEEVGERPGGFVIATTCVAAAPSVDAVYSKCAGREGRVKTRSVRKIEPPHELAPVPHGHPLEPARDGFEDAGREPTVQIRARFVVERDLVA